MFKSNSSLRNSIHSLRSHQNLNKASFQVFEDQQEPTKHQKNIKSVKSKLEEDETEFEDLNDFGIYDNLQVYEPFLIEKKGQVFKLSKIPQVVFIFFAFVYDIIFIPTMGLLINIFLFFFDIYKLLRYKNLDFSTFALVFIAKMGDIYQTFSIFGIIYHLIYYKIHKIYNCYFVFSQVCVIFFIFFIFLLVFLEIQIYESFFDKSLFQLIKNKVKIKYMSYKGIWSISNTIYKKYNILQKCDRYKKSFLQVIKDKDFEQRVHEISKSIKVDLSLFYFGYIQDSINEAELNVNNSNNTPHQAHVISQIRGNNCAVTLHAQNNILWRNYKYSSHKYKDQATPFSIMLFTLVIKVIIPLVYLIKESKKDINYELFIFINGFYLYILNSFYLTINNQDLNRRFQIQQSISQLVNFEDFEIEDREYFINNKQFKTNDSILLRKKLDATCPLSIETWDNCRKIALEFDLPNTETFEISYIFLGFYYLFITIICASYYSGFDFIFDKDSAQGKIYNNPLILIHITMDFILISIVFLQRIYDGERYNGIFEEQINYIDSLIGVYDDIIELYDHYFNEKIQNKVTDDLYLVIIQRVKSITHISKSTMSNSQFQVNYMKNIRKSLKKIKQSISLDKEKYKYKLFNIFNFEFQETITTLVIGLLTIIPLIHQKLIEVFTDTKDTIK